MNRITDKDRRLRSTRRITELFEHSHRVSDGRLTVLAAGNELGWTRAAYAVSRRHGTAVRRNRVRRLCREAFRQSFHAIPAGLDLVIMPRVRQDHTLDNLAASMKSLAQKLRPAVKDSSP